MVVDIIAGEVLEIVEGEEVEELELEVFMIEGCQSQT